ncbi:MAG: hypothetical protein ABI702_24300 [Burkholderiales bacterium]
MGFLDDLKRQADEAKARQNTDTHQLERNTALADVACKTASSYFNTLVQQLNVLQPRSKVTYRLDRRHAFPGLTLSDFRADARRKRLRGAEVFDHVALRWRLASGQRLALVKDFPPDIEQLESRLRRSGAQVHAETIRNPVNNKLQEMRYEFVADFEAAVNITPDHDAGRLRFEAVNLDGFETVTLEFAAFEVGTGRMDELARWIMGEPHAFFNGAQGLRRVEA